MIGSPRQIESELVGRLLREVAALRAQVAQHHLQHELGGADTVRPHVRDDGTDTTGRFRTTNYVAPITVSVDTANQEYDIGLSVALDQSTYTPTLTNVTNIDASTAYQCQYIRVGSTVVVSGRVDVDPTAGAPTETELGISLPIASNFGGTEDCGGTAVCLTLAAEAAAIHGSIASDRAEMLWNTVSTANRGYFFIFMYQVI